MLSCLAAHLWDEWRHFPTEFQEFYEVESSSTYENFHFDQYLDLHCNFSMKFWQSINCVYEFDSVKYEFSEVNTVRGICKISDKNRWNLGPD
mgnify:CR=1 FL=1